MHTVKHKLYSNWYLGCKFFIWASKFMNSYCYLGQFVLKSINANHKYSSNWTLSILPYYTTYFLMSKNKTIACKTVAWKTVACNTAACNTVACITAACKTVAFKTVACNAVACNTFVCIAVAYNTVVCEKVACKTVAVHCSRILCMKEMRVM